MEHRQRLTAFGIRLRELRHERGWDRLTLAVEAGCHEATVQRVECGGNVTLDVLLRLLDALEADLGAIQR